MTKQEKKRRAGTLSACLAFVATLLVTEQGEAQDPPKLCIGAKKDVPTLTGVPRWFSTDPVTSDLPDTPLLDDPRWANAARQPFGDEGQDASLRTAYDPTNNQLLVSIHMKQARDLGTQNAVYFGISDGNTTGHAVRMFLPSRVTSGSDAPKENGPQAFLDLAEFTVRKTNNPKDTAPTWSSVSAAGEAPAWLLYSGAWINPSDSRGWAVNFKISLGHADLGYASNAPLYLFMGTRVLNGSGNFGYRKSPQKAAEDGRYVFSEDNNTNLIVPANVISTWHPTNAPNTPCLGLSLPRAQIGVRDRNSPAGSNLLTTFLEAGGNIAHKLYAKATNSDPDKLIGPGQVGARFRLAAWGAQSRGAWEEIAESGGRDVIPINGDGSFELSCPPNHGNVADADAEICGVPLDELGNRNAAGDEAHQCILVEMERLSTTDEAVGIATGSEFRNFGWDVASKVERVAVIDIEGLTAKFGPAEYRDVYLYVDRHNMPPLSSTRLPELPRSEMFAKRLEVAKEFSCTLSEQSCVGNICAYPCIDDAEFGGCNGNDVPSWIDDACYCAPEEGFQVCMPDTSSPNEAAMLDDEKLSTVWPYYQVWAYVDTGKRATINGVEQKQVEPLVPFGLMIDHEGEYYGWTDKIEGLGDAIVHNVGPDVYRVRVPNESQAKLLVTVEAHDEKPEVPLTDIVGTSVSFGLIGNLEMCGVMQATEPVNLGKANVTVNYLLGDNGVERVTNKPNPLVLKPRLPLIPGSATFANSASLFGPRISMDIIDLPLIGRVVKTHGAGLSIARPTGCGFLGGSAQLETSFSIMDNLNPEIAVSGTDQWTCTPFSMVNL